MILYLDFSGLFAGIVIIGASLISFGGFLFTLLYAFTKPAFKNKFNDTITLNLKIKVFHKVIIFFFTVYGAVTSFFFILRWSQKRWGLDRGGGIVLWIFLCFFWLSVWFTVNFPQVGVFLYPIVTIAPIISFYNYATTEIIWVDWWEQVITFHTYPEISLNFFSVAIIGILAVLCSILCIIFWILVKMKMNSCPKCTTHLYRNAIFCGKCGYVIKEEKLDREESHE